MEGNYRLKVAEMRRFFPETDFKMLTGTYNII